MSSGFKDIIVYEKGILGTKDNSYYRTQADGKMVYLKICQGVTQIEEGFFDAFDIILEIAIPDTVSRLNFSEEFSKRLKEQNTVIKGSFDSCADKFAKAQNLPFIHSDIQIGYVEGSHSRDIITLCFGHYGSPYIYQNSVSPGISASSTGGGESRIELKSDFYLRNSQKDIADMCWGCCHKAILENNKLKSFLQKAKTRNGYTRNL
ncbi:MAG: hypothetical protein VZR11_08960 [Succinimonas sp.]|nr:hypothetical protein [Succinimonas sp.]